MKLDEIQKLVDSATPGPWYAGRDSVATNPTSAPGYPPDMAVIASLYDGEYIENPNSERDTKFIAAARELVPKLLAVAVAAKKCQRAQEASERQKYSSRIDSLEDFRQANIAFRQYIEARETMHEALRELEEI